MTTRAFSPSIRQKLIGISMLTVICALGLAGAVFFVDLGRGLSRSGGARRHYNR